jgi:hypothetical protein
MRARLSIVHTSEAKLVLPAPQGPLPSAGFVAVATEGRHGRTSMAPTARLMPQRAQSRRSPPSASGLPPSLSSMSDMTKTWVPLLSPPTTPPAATQRSSATGLSPPLDALQPLTAHNTMLPPTTCSVPSSLLAPRSALSVDKPPALTLTPASPLTPRPPIVHQAWPLHTLKVCTVESQRRSILASMICSIVPMLDFMMGDGPWPSDTKLSLAQEIGAGGWIGTITTAELIMKPKDDRDPDPRWHDRAPLYAALLRQGVQEA